LSISVDVHRKKHDNTEDDRADDKSDDEAGYRTRDDAIKGDYSTGPDDREENESTSDDANEDHYSTSDDAIEGDYLSSDDDNNEADVNNKADDDQVRFWLTLEQRRHWYLRYDCFLLTVTNLLAESDEN